MVSQHETNHPDYHAMSVMDFARLMDERREANKANPCPGCDGYGIAPHALLTYGDCPQCGGTGKGGPE